MIAIGKTAGETGHSNPILPSSPAPYFARQILVQEDHSIFPAFRIVGEEGEASPIIVSDTTGYKYVIVEMRCRLPVGASGGPFAIPDVDTEAANRLGFLYRFA